MELLVILGALLLLAILAMRYGVDSRVDGPRRGSWWTPLVVGDSLFDAARSHLAEVRYESHAAHLADLALATTRQPTIRRRLASGLHTLAARIDPLGYTLSPGSAPGR